MDQSRDDRSLGELFGELSRQTSLLVRQEVALARAEMKEKASSAGKHVAMIAAGGAVAYAGFLALLAAIVIILANALPWWLSALIVAIVVLAVGALLIQKGRSGLQASNLAPEKTVETIKEDAEWAKRQIG